jgi:hypothetical protein
VIWLNEPPGALSQSTKNQGDETNHDHARGNQQPDRDYPDLITAKFNDQFVRNGAVPPARTRRSRNWRGWRPGHRLTNRHDQFAFHLLADAEPLQHGRKVDPALPRPGKGNAICRTSARLSASGELMSGLLAPLRTAMPMPERASRFE